MYWGQNNLNKAQKGDEGFNTDKMSRSMALIGVSYAGTGEGWPMCRKTIVSETNQRRK